MYKLQVTINMGNPKWITIIADSEGQARGLAYGENPNYQILCCKEWDGVEGSYYN